MTSSEQAGSTQLEDRQQLFSNPADSLPTSEQSANSHSLQAFVQARDEYTWGDRQAVAVTPQLEAAYREIMHWRPNLFVPPRGASANELVIEMATLLQGFTEKSGFERVSLTAFFTLPHLILQLPASRRAAAKRKALDRRLRMWRDGDIEGLLAEGRAIQERLQTSQRQMTWQRGFVRLMLAGHSSAAMRLLRNGSSGGLLSLDDRFDDKTVFDILREKHPDPAPLNPQFIETAPLPDSQHGHAVLFESVDGPAIVKAVLTTQGGAGPSGLNANAWRHLLTGYRASPQLAEAIAGVARRLCTEYVDPQSILAYTCSRLVAIDKNPGVRPVGIGEVVRRIVGKVALRVISKDLRRVAGNVQLCVGQRAGIESAIHELRSSFNSSTEQCVLQIDAKNAFNTVNRSLALRNVESVCPLLQTLLVNIYRNESLLPVSGELLYSREGLTQGDNLAMAAFGANSMPLIRYLNEHLSAPVLQRWYADDANATGNLSNLREFYDLVTLIGPNYGYQVHPTKCWLIVHPGKLEEARQAFEGLPINITEKGHQLLGSAIGTEEFMHSFTKTRCEEYVGEVDRLTEIASEKPHLAYSALVHCLQTQWQHFLRTTPLADDALQQVDEAVTTRLLPLMFKRPSISEIERQWLSLPTREGGLAIRVFSDQDLSAEHLASQQICQPLSDGIGSEECEIQQEVIATRIRRRRMLRMQERATALHPRLDTAQQYAREVAKEKGASSWLHTRPLETQGYHLSPVEFRDAVAVRMAWTPSELPKSCHCGAQFTVPHALSCPLGGLPTIRHNETRDLLADVMTEACNSVAIEPTLTPVDGRVFQQSSTTTDANARVDIVASGVWGGRFDRVYFDVCVFNAFAQSNSARSLPAAYEFHERRKITKYAERVREVEHSSFTPLVFSSSGGCGPMTLSYIKRLAHLLATKRKIKYADAISWLRRRLCFSLLRANSQCLRGARSKLHFPQHPSNTCIPATNAATIPLTH